MDNEDIFVLISIYRVLPNRSVEGGRLWPSREFRRVPFVLRWEGIYKVLGNLLLVSDRLIPLLWPCDHVLVLVARCRFEIYLPSPSWAFAVLLLLKRIIVRLQEDSICVDRLRYDLIAPESTC